MPLFQRLIASLIFTLSLSFNAYAEVDTENPIVVISTNKGDITLELYPNEAPVTVANFLNYVETGFYEGTIFHRVIQRFMIQGGGMTEDMNKKTNNPPIVNESVDGLPNDHLTIAMARTNDPDSATSQFFINVKNNNSLDSQQGEPGYTVFGKVIDGDYVVEAIEKVATHTVSHFSDVPVEAIIIEAATIKQPIAEPKSQEEKSDIEKN